jgi:DNA-binding CsgD family transcriptional regulator
MSIITRSLDEIFFHVANKLNRVNSTGDAHAALLMILEEYGLESATYFAVNLPNMSDDRPYILSTYSEEWLNHYSTQKYLTIDPVISVGFSSILPIDWRAIDRADASQRRLFAESLEFGLGKQGLTVPIAGKNGERALFSITCNFPDSEWSHILRIYMRDFQVLAYHLHQMILRVESLEEEQVKLAPREIECLKWAARGKTVAEIGTILSLSDRTVRFYLDLARAKLNATNITHAVSKALSLNLLFKSR